MAGVWLGRLDKQNRIKIPRDLVEQLGWGPNQQVVLYVQDGKLTIVAPDDILVKVGNKTISIKSGTETKIGPETKSGHRSKKTNVEKLVVRADNYKPPEPQTRPPRVDEESEKIREDLKKIVKLAESKLSNMNKEYFTENDLKKVWEICCKNIRKIPYDAFKEILLEGIFGEIDAILYEPEKGKYKLI